jgi:hypothetical protein
MKIKVLLSSLGIYRKKKFLPVTTISIIFLFFGTFFTPSLSQTAVTTYEQNTNTISGHILFSPMYSTKTFLINSTGSITHIWSSNFLPGVGVRWLGNGTILRTIRVDVGPGEGGAGGGVQKVEWDGTVVWDFRYNSNGCLSHHDIKPLPNGNMLLIAWETKTRTEAIAAGRNPSNVSSYGFMPDHIIEVQPTGPTSGAIVWEWHVWDHLIQDYDSAKENYGAVADHPELVDINYGTYSKSDWMHTNSIDYNEEFDQILLSVCYFNEIWVIDHSTTTQEATGHTGGRSGKGGDLLYRWGNPAAYRAGTKIDQKFFNQHDASWITDGCPGEGNILVFNNGPNRPGQLYSTVDEIIPPVNENGEYDLEPGSAYGPTVQTWIYSANPPTSFYSNHVSSAERLPDGNTLICMGAQGKFLEITPLGTIVWMYKNNDPTPTTCDVYKIDYIPPEEITPEPDTSDLDCSGSLSWSDIKPGVTVTGNFQIRNIGNSSSLLNWKINTTSINWGAWTFTPASGVNLSPADGQVTVQVSVLTPNEKNADFEGYIHVENADNPNDIEEIPVILKTAVYIRPAWLTLLYQYLFDLLQRNPLFDKLSNL